ncbi:MAG: ATP-dependent DNA helicase RecG [Bifidobacteriaceae bacterium]|nr:ATP-dependent DNA helicase RecG [Bifidobacteriaceae bacterium]
MTPPARRLSGALSDGLTPADSYLASRVDAAAGRAGRKLAESGLKTIRDLLRHFPKRYEDPRLPSDMGLLRLEETVTINARVQSTAVRPIKNNSQWLVNVVITDGRHKLDLAFFLKRRHLAAYYEREYWEGRMGLFTGRVKAYRGVRQLVHPEVIWEDQAATQDPRFAGRLIPIYPSVAGVQSPILQRAIQTSLTALGDDSPSDPLPAAILEPRGLPILGRALWQVHNPSSLDEANLARDRFRFEEAFILQTALAQRRHQAWQAGGAVRRSAVDGPDSLVRALDRRLPFELTPSQRAAGRKIAGLLDSSAPMNQLLQGDVGSGKTVVALRAMLQVIQAGGQAVLLAPTEVLAAQHFRTIRELLGPLASVGGSEPPEASLFEASSFSPDPGLPAASPGAVSRSTSRLSDAALSAASPSAVSRSTSRLFDATLPAGPPAPAARLGIRLLTGSLTAKTKAEALALIETGEVGLVVGTHALLEPTVQFKDLGLVVVDEQHRFGVEQRDALRTRGPNLPHVLVMTATPIPRTVAMTVFGDLGVTVLKDGPPGRLPVNTVWVNPATHPAWLDRVWQRVAEEVAGGHRAFVICPAIEPGEVESGTELVEEPEPAEQGQLAFPELDLGGMPGGGIVQVGGSGTGPGTARRPLASVSQTLEQLTAEPALRGVRLAALHGRMNPAEKDRTMAAFQRGEVDLLVATTVVEVGVDVPQATALVVLEADRFGLSQLHQLRGRVGRGTDPAVCLLVSQTAPETTAAARLEAMRRSRDGFELAEVDLENRREGQVLGDSQSGSSSLRLVRLTRDAGLIADARQAAGDLVNSDPELTGWPALADAITSLLAGREAYLERG